MNGSGDTASGKRKAVHQLSQRRQKALPAGVGTGQAAVRTEPQRLAARHGQDVESAAEPGSHADAALEQSRVCSRILLEESQRLKFGGK